MVSLSTWKQEGRSGGDRARLEESSGTGPTLCRGAGGEGLCSGAGPPRTPRDKLPSGSPAWPVRTAAPPPAASPSPQPSSSQSASPCTRGAGRSDGENAGYLLYLILLFNQTSWFDQDHVKGRARAGKLKSLLINATCATQRLPSARGEGQLQPPAFGARARGGQGGVGRARKVAANGAEKSWCPAAGARRGEEPEEAAGRHGVRPFLKEREKDRDGREEERGDTQ